MATKKSAPKKKGATKKSAPKPTKVSKPKVDLSLQAWERGESIQCEPAETE